MKAQVQDQAAVLGSDESIAEFCQRNAIVRSRREAFGVECRIVTPTLYCFLPPGYEYDNCGTEQDEPATGAVYKFSAGQRDPLSPFGGWDMIAVATREDDMLILEIGQQD